MLRRSIISGLLIALLGPPLGYAAVVAWVALDYGPQSALMVTRFPDIVILPYMIGSAPAAVAGLVAGWRIWRHGWITPLFWGVATLIALVPSLYFLDWRQTQSFKILYVSDRELAVLYIVATLFASAMLRLLLVLTRLMRKGGQQ